MFAGSCVDLYALWTVVFETDGTFFVVLVCGVLEEEKVEVGAF